MEFEVLMSRDVLPEKKTPVTLILTKTPTP